MYEIYVLIKFINKQNYLMNKKKTNILTFVFINIYNSLLLSVAEYQYFLKIINNHFQKI